MPTFDAHAVETQPAVTPIEVAEPNEAQSILLAARDLIADESKWCKGHLFNHGQYCAVGAMAWGLGVSTRDEDDAYSRVYDSPAGKYLGVAASEILDDGFPVTQDIVQVNDDNDHRTVMAMFNRAIELAGK